MERLILENQIVIMQALVRDLERSFSTEGEMIKTLREQIEFTQARLRAMP